MKDKLKQKNGNKKMSSKLPLQQSGQNSNGKRKDIEGDDVEQDFNDEEMEESDELEQAAPATAKASKSRR